MDNDKLIQEFISVMAMFSSPFLSEFSLEQILGEIEKILLYEAMERFIVSSGSLSAVDTYKRYFCLE